MGHYTRAKDDRLYARFDIAMDEHPKIMLLSDAAFRSLIECTMYSRRQKTDGFLHERVALKKWGEGVLRELSSNHPERPSLARVNGGWQIHDFDKHQVTSSEIEAKREAGRKGGRASGRARAKQSANESEARASNPLKQNANESEAKTESETETKGGPSAPLDATPPPPQTDSSPPIGCAKHPGGTDSPCRACGDARRARDEWDRQQKAKPTPTPQLPEYCPKHPGYPTQPTGCDRCKQDAEEEAERALREADAFAEIAQREGDAFADVEGVDHVAD